MEKIINRKPFQGLTNIIRFNWHFYLLAIISISILAFIRIYWFQNFYFDILQILILFSFLASLVVSSYVYDYSGFYKMDWLQQINFNRTATIANINAGFDETSAILQSKFQTSELLVFDFYDPKKHTEVSIKRARKLYPSYPGTISIDTKTIPFGDSKIDSVFLIFAVHEIRNQEERITFFKELNRVLHDDGKIILIEHLRDFANFSAFNIGFFHFYSKRNWIKTVQNSNLKIASETKLTPFTSLFIISKNGITS